MLEILNYILDAPHCMPTRGHIEDAGLDLRAKNKIVVPAHGSAVIDTGVHFEIPEGYYGKLESKSGLNIKNDVVSLGGTIDAGYTGTIMAKLYNFGNKDHVFEAGDKVVQIIFMACECPCLREVKEFKETDRGNNGFGSTGVA